MPQGGPVARAKRGLMGSPAFGMESEGQDGSSGSTDEPPLATPTEFTSRRLVMLQILRGIAALMVVFHHVLHQSPGFLAVWPTEAGQAGVDLFFVISGFVMVYVTNEREQSAAQFLTMRAIRIVPVYWFYTLIAAALMFFLPQLFRGNELSVKHVLLSLLFIPHDSQGSLSPLIKQGWTLDLEVFFYILFAIAMAIAARQRVSIAVATLAVMTAISYIMRFTGISPGVLGFYFDNIILEFAFGMLIAKAFLGGRLRPFNPIIGLLVLLSGFVLLFALDPLFTAATRVIVYGLPAAAIVIGTLILENRTQPFRLPLLQFIGDASYSIYLVHIFPVAILRTLWPRVPLPMSGIISLALFLSICVTFVIGVAAASYYGIERTSLRYLRKKVARRRA
jgi:exopolysaccharide production protein ExoZ